MAAEAVELMLKIVAVGGVVALVVGFGAGYKVRDAFCDAGEAKAQVLHLQRQLLASKEAEAANTKLILEQDEALLKLENDINEMRGKISVGECFTDGDVDRLRRLWPTRR
jgi:hypothetical protein